jgi:3-hydroxyacyl-CoA dehydrogenase
MDPQLRPAYEAQAHAMVAAAARLIIGHPSSGPGQLSETAADALAAPLSRVLARREPVASSSDIADVVELIVAAAQLGRDTSNSR